VLQALREMGLEEDLKQIEIPRSKQRYFNQNGHHIRDFDEESINKYKEEGYRFERHRFHEILLRKIKPLIVKSTDNVTVYSNISRLSQPNTTIDNYDSEHFKMNQVIYSMKTSLFNKEKIEVVFMNKNDWLHLQYQSNADHNRKTSTPQKTLKTHIEDSHTPGSGDSESKRNSVGWKRFFLKKEMNARASPSQQCANSKSDIIVGDDSSLNNLCVTFNDGENFENSIYQSPNDRELYKIEREDYDLVIGADGIHSQTRTLLFGDESQFKHFLGVGFFCFIVDMVLDSDDEKMITKKYTSLGRDVLDVLIKASKSIDKHICDKESISILLKNGRYINILRFGKKLSVTCVYRQSKNEESVEEENTTENHSMSTPVSRKRFSIFKKSAEELVEPSGGSILTNQFYGFDQASMAQPNSHQEHNDPKEPSERVDSDTSDEEEVVDVLFGMLDTAKVCNVDASELETHKEDEQDSNNEKKKRHEKSHHSQTVFIPSNQRKKFLKEKFGDCLFLFADVMELVLSNEIIYYDDLAQIRNLDCWHKGRCVLVGDACQAVTPLSGKGGAMAIISAKTLGQEIRRVLETHASKEGEENLHTLPLEPSIYFDSSLEEAFTKYEISMKERVKRVQKKTVWEGVSVYLATSGVKRLVRDNAIKWLPKKLLLKLAKKDQRQGDEITE